MMQNCVAGKKSKKIRFVFFTILESFVLTAIVCFFACAFSCRVTERGIVFVDESYECPKIMQFTVLSSDSVRIVFDSSVSVKSAGILPEEKSVVPKITESSESSGICVVDFLFGENLQIGKNYRLFGVVQDSIGNSLTFSIPFSGFNENIPSLEITEVHPKYASSKNKNGTVYKCEYIELRALSGGNLAGLSLFSAYDGEDKAYSFPAIDVKKDEIIIVHLRTKENELCVDELSEDLTLSKAKYSSDEARDLWEQNDSARLGDENDVILLKNNADGTVLDAVCYASSLLEDWKTENLKRAAEEAVSYGKWNSSLICDAVFSDGMTATKSIEKIKSGNEKSSWTLSNTSGETPGIAY